MVGILFQSGFPILKQWYGTWQMDTKSSSQLSQIDLFTGPFNLTNNFLLYCRPSPSTCPALLSHRSISPALRCWPQPPRGHRSPLWSSLSHQTWWPSPSPGAQPLTSSGWRPSSPTSWTTNNNRWDKYFKFLAQTYLLQNLGWSNSTFDV